MSAKFQRAGTIKELTSKGRLVVRGSHRPILVVEDQGQIFALDNRCPHHRSSRRPEAAALLRSHCSKETAPTMMLLARRGRSVNVIGPETPDDLSLPHMAKSLLRRWGRAP